ncbi:Mbov_0396 family ICE element transmembrane protein [Enterocloster asparagiformis]|uniref:Mbov_0396 family ICE element transmembrane protein n=1 Tax=Enterocloster asparagiformis TaxID=333367 RepID=UPI002A82A745|nr:hypothetical protein [Enterocloster asparagiformis]
MNVAYLGIFQTILNWVLEKIFSPVFKFVANLLATVFGWIFDTVLAPLLNSVLIPLIDLLIDLIFQALAGVFYRILVSVLTLVDYIQIAFDVLIGIRNVSYTPANHVVVKEPLLDVMFYQKSVQTAFWMVLILALAMAFMFAIYATAKSAFDLDFEGRRPVGTVLKALFRAAVNFLTVPLFVLFMLKLSGIILMGVNSALTQGTNCTLGNTIFLVASMDACKQEEYNVSYDGGGKVQNIGFEDAVRSPYASGSKSYADIKTVEKEFNVGRIDYIVGYGVSIFLLIILAICLIQFVQRIFEIILLFIVSPLFVSVMPLDDGEKFAGWRELFVAKCFTGFGAAFGMRLYLMVVGIIMGNSIDFTAGGSISREMDYVLKLLIVMGGAFAIFKSSSMLTMLMNWRAADSEMSTAAAVGGTLYAHSVGKISHSVYGGIHRTIEHRRDGGGSGGQAFQGGRGFQGGAGAGNSVYGPRGTGGPGVAVSGPRGTGEPGMAEGASGAGAAWVAGSAAVAGAARNISFGKNPSGRMTVGYRGSHLKVGTGADRGRGVQLDGRLIKRKTNKDGSVTVNAPIVSLKAGPGGGKLKWNGLNMGVFKTRKGADQRQHLAGVNLGVVKLKRDKSSRMRVKSVNIKAAQFRRMDDGRLHTTRALGQQVEQTEDSEGRYRTTGISFEKHNTHVSFQRHGMDPQMKEESTGPAPQTLQKRPAPTPAQVRARQQRVNLTPGQRQRIERSMAARRQAAGPVRPGEGTAINRPPIVRSAVRSREKAGRPGSGRGQGKG